MLYYSRKEKHTSWALPDTTKQNMKNLMTNFWTRLPLMVFVVSILCGVVYSTVPKVIKYLFLYEQQGEMHTLLIPMVLFVYANIAGVIIATTRVFLSRPLKSWNEFGLVSMLFLWAFLLGIIGMVIGNIVGLYFRGFTYSDFMWGFAIHVILLAPLMGLISGLFFELRKSRSVKQEDPNDKEGFKIIAP